MTVEFAYIKILFVQLPLLSNLFVPEISFVDESADGLCRLTKAALLAHSTKNRANKLFLISLFRDILEEPPLCE